MAPPPLRLMPTEVLSLAAEKLCVHCLDPEAARRGGNNAINTAALATLGQTSRRFNGIANGYLFHAPALTDPSRWPLLARTLIARPDLASKVHILEIDDDQFDSADYNNCTWYSTFSCNGWTRLPEVMAFYNAQKAIHDPNGTPPYCVHTDRRSATKVLTALCPNIRKLSSTHVHRDAFLFLGAPGTLMLNSLTEIDLNPPGHYNALALCNELLRVAPNLARITIRNIRWGFRFPPGHLLATDIFPNVRYLRVENACLDRAILRQILEHFPNLEVFHYTAGGYELGQWQFELLDGANDVVRRNGGHLREFHLDFSRDVWPTHNHWNNPQPHPRIPTRKQIRTARWLVRKHAGIRYQYVPHGPDVRFRMPLHPEYQQS